MSELLKEYRELKEKVKRLQMVLDLLPAVVIIKDLNLRHIYVNSEFEYVAQLKREEVLGKTDHEIFPKEVADVIYEQDVTTIKSKQVTQSWGDVPHPDGTMHEYLNNKTPVLDENGNVVELLIIAQDTNERKLHEEEIKIAKEKAEMASKAKSIFLANMSHELRTPLNAILGFAEILKNLEADPQKAAYLEIIHKSGNVLNSLINDILDLSKVEAGKIELDYSPVSIQDLLKEAEILFKQKAIDNGLDFSSDFNAPPCLLLLDETRIRQILFNLIGNAIKYTENGSVFVAIEIQKIGDGSHGRVDLSIKVQDTGIGIDPDQQEKIFESFKQVSGGKRKTNDGLGLGLAISRQLSGLMNGTLSVDSELGVGSTFTLNIPDVEIAVNADRLDSIEKIFDVESILFEPATILIVDDIDYNRELLSSYLSPWDFSFIKAENGKIALDLIQKQQPDLILMDMKMPEMDGYETIELIRKKDIHKDIPIIAVTASSLKEEEKQIRKICEGYLRKPCSQGDLINELMRFLPHRILKVTSSPDNQNGSIHAQKQITAEALAALPHEWLEVFSSAVYEADSEKCLDLVREIPELPEELKHITSALHQMIQNYSFLDLINLIKELGVGHE